MTNYFKRSIVCVMIMSFCLFSCEPKAIPVPQEQQVLFEVYYINFAWGKQHNGFIIDKEGKLNTISE